MARGVDQLKPRGKLLGSIEGRGILALCGADRCAGAGEGLDRSDTVAVPGEAEAEAVDA